MNTNTIIKISIATILSTSVSANMLDYRDNLINKRNIKIDMRNQKAELRNHTNKIKFVDRRDIVNQQRNKKTYALLINKI